MARRGARRPGGRRGAAGAAGPEGPRQRALPAASHGGDSLTGCSAVPERRRLGGERHGLARACPTHPARVRGTRTFHFPVTSPHVMPAPFSRPQTGHWRHTRNRPAMRVAGCTTGSARTRCPRTVRASSPPGIRLSGCPPARPQVRLHFDERGPAARWRSVPRHLPRPSTRPGPAPPRSDEESVPAKSVVGAGATGAILAARGPTASSRRVAKGYYIFPVPWPGGTVPKYRAPAPPPTSPTGSPLLPARAAGCWRRAPT
jgi:hypothetical protein